MDKETLFRKYLHSEMNETEFKEFKSQLDSSEELRQELRIHEAMYEDRAKKIKAQLKSGTSSQINHLNFNNKTAKIKWIRRFAAAFIFMIAAYGIMIYFNNVTSHIDNLENSYIAEVHLPPSVKMGENTKINAWSLAIEAYRNQEFDIAKEQIKEIENPNDEQSLYLGLCYLYAQKPDYNESLHILESINQKDKSIVKDESIWYISLIHLLQNDKENAQLGFERIIRDKSWNHKKAEKLLSDIKLRDK